MAYQPTFWVNNAEPAITAEKLNKIEQGIATSAGVADSKASVDYVNSSISDEVNNRINYVDNQVNTLSDITDVKIGQVRLDIEQALEDPNSVISINVQDILNTSVVDPNNTTVNSYIKSTAVSAVDTEWSLNSLTTNIASQFGPNASNIEQGVLSLADTEWSLNTLTTNLNSKFGPNASNIDQAITTSVNDEFALSTMKTNLESAFGTNISNINTKLSTYATNEDVGAIAQVQLDVNGKITGWTAVDSSVGGSAFRINADTFSIADGTNEHTPLSIDATTGISQFNGILNVYNNTTGSYYKVADKFDDIQTQIDGKVESWFYAYPPSNTKLPTSTWIANGTRNLHINDMFYDTANKRLYRYTSGYTWEEIVNADAITASEAAANAEAGLDGKITTFSSSTTPVAEAVGDLWIHPTTNIMKRWSGSSWTTIDVATAFNNGNTTIDGGKITTGSITATQIKAGTITASEIAANTITVDEIDTTSITLNALGGSISWSNVDNTPTIPSNLSDLTNDQGFVTTAYSGFTHIDAYGVYTGDILANQITTGTLDASNITVTNLTADSISTGTLTIDRLPALSLQGQDTSVYTGSNNLSGSNTTKTTATLFDLQFVTNEIKPGRFVDAEVSLSYNLTSQMYSGCEVTIQYYVFIRGNYINMDDIYTPVIRELPYTSSSTTKTYTDSFNVRIMASSSNVLNDACSVEVRAVVNIDGTASTLKYEATSGYMNVTQLYR